MKNHADVIELVERAQRGDAVGLNRLADSVKARLYEYTVRMTLDEQLAEDIVQESLLTMVQDIGALRESGQFWPWLMTIATNKVRHHYRRNGRRSALLSSRPAFSSPNDPASSNGAQDALADAISKEIRQIVLSAMHRLPLEHRLILNMRCYEEMSFGEIAEALGCRKFKARALFAKAKRTLGRNLAQSGLGKASLLGTLVIYGKLTATSEASGMAMSVTGATLKTGLLPALAAVTTTRMALVTVAALGVTATAASLIVSGPEKSTFFGESRTSIVAPNRSRHGQDVQFWYYYPPQSEGVVLIQIGAVAESGRSEWRWFQNEEGSFSCSGRAVQRRNAHYYAPDLATMRLPTDGAAMRAFLDRIESGVPSGKYVRPAQRGLLVVTGTDDGQPFTHVRTGYDITDEQAFQNPWQHDVKITDCRDELHREGWAYLRISGYLNGRTVAGVGRIPFVLAKRRTVSPWVRLTFEDSITLEDNSDVAVVRDRNGRVRQRFAGGTFLEGLSRPWEGLHTLDTVRRDAARHRLRFEIRNVVENQQAEVAVMDRNVELVFAIDLDRDVLRELSLYADQAEVGRLRLEYVQELGTGRKVAGEPESDHRRSSRQRRSDTLWLLRLMRGDWD